MLTRHSSRSLLNHLTIATFLGTIFGLVFFFIEPIAVFRNRYMGFEELTHVPMIFWDPQRYDGGVKITDMVRHVDVMSTIAEITGARRP